MTTGELNRVDHLIYGTPDLESTLEDLERLLGLRATIGGRHPGEGTRNALYSLGSGQYLEIMGPDPDQPDPDRPRWLGLDMLTGPRMVAWAAKATELEAFREHAAAKNIPLGSVLSGSRQRPDGSELTWTLTDPRQWIADGVVPFFIDWGDGPHPSESAVSGLRLKEFRIEHPDPERVRSALRVLDLSIAVSYGAGPALIASLETPAGEIQLT